MFTHSLFDVIATASFTRSGSPLERSRDGRGTLRLTGPDPDGHGMTSATKLSDRTLALMRVDNTINTTDRGTRGNRTVRVVDQLIAQWG